MKRQRPPKPALREVTDAEIDAAINEAFDAAQSATPALHQMFDQQVRTVMEDAGLSEEEKQSVLVAMSCPCCGGGTSSFTYKLRPKA